jgi:hypothetical protein
MSSSPRESKYQDDLRSISLDILAIIESERGSLEVAEYLNRKVNDFMPKESNYLIPNYFLLVKPDRNLLKNRMSQIKEDLAEYIKTIPFNSVVLEPLQEERDKNTLSFTRIHFAFMKYFDQLQKFKLELDTMKIVEKLKNDILRQTMNRIPSKNRPNMVALADKYNEILQNPDITLKEYIMNDSQRQSLISQIENYQKRAEEDKTKLKRKVSDQSSKFSKDFLKTMLKMRDGVLPPKEKGGSIF